MFRTHAHIHFNSAGEPWAVAVELISDPGGDALTTVVMQVGPFDDFSEVYARCYQEAVDYVTKQMPGQVSMFPQAHPRVHLRRTTDALNPTT